MRLRVRLNTCPCVVKEPSESGSSDHVGLQATEATQEVEDKGEVQHIELNALIAPSSPEEHVAFTGTARGKGARFTANQSERYRGQSVATHRRRRTQQPSRSDPEPEAFDPEMLNIR